MGSQLAVANLTDLEEVGEEDGGGDAAGVGAAGLENLRHRPPPRRPRRRRPRARGLVAVAPGGGEDGDGVVDELEEGAPVRGGGGGDGGWLHGTLGQGKGGEVGGKTPENEDERGVFRLCP